MYSVSRKNIPKIEVPRPKPIRLAPVIVRRLKNESGTSGACERSSSRMNVAIRTAEAVSTPIVCVDVQPTRLACVRPKTSRIRLDVTVTAPQTSKWRAMPSALLSRTKRGTK